MTRSTDRHWEALAQRDPLWAILGGDTLRANALTPEAEAQFWRSGEQHVRTILRDVEESVGPVQTSGLAIDFGCGVGRATLPLARSFDRVVGVDVALSMLHQASAKARSLGVGNVSFDQSLPEPRSATFVHSWLVLQHMPPARGEQLFRDLNSCLVPGGAGVVQIVSGGPRGRVSRLTAAAAGMRMGRQVANVIRGRPLREPRTGMYSYDVGRILAVLAERGVVRVALTDLRQVGEWLTVALVWRQG